MYNVRIPRTAPLVVCVLLLCASAASVVAAASWPMRQRDAMNTGRASFVVPSERLNSSFFDIFLWQAPVPGSPNEGGISSTQMTFFDGVGPGGADIVVGSYHWPKGVQGMDRTTGRVFWYGNPCGGETIGTIAPAFSPNGSSIYVVNDATSSTEWPNGHPLMAFSTQTGPSSYRHNGSDPNPGQLGAGSPKIAPDGRVFMHSWVDRPYGGTDSGSAITTTWAAATSSDCGLAGPAVYDDGGTLKVVIAGRSGWVKCYDGTTGAELWAKYTGVTMDADVTIDPSNGNIYVGAGGDDIYVVGLDIDGNPLWGPPAVLVYNYESGVNNPQRAQAVGCLSHDGSTYYFQTNSQQGDGKLYAIDTFEGSAKWAYATQSKGWETNSSSPIVTPNGVIVVGNNEGGVYYALRDEGVGVALIDTLQVSDGGSARASASLSDDGLLYIPIRTLWTTSNGDGGSPTFQAANLFTAINLNAGATQILPPPPGQAAVALNHAVRVSWSPVIDSTGQFDHYAVYRSTSAFGSVEGMTPVGVASGVNSTTYTDSTAVNGTHYYYAVTSVTLGGGEPTAVDSIGPRTPRNETDLQVLSVGRTPRYPRYSANYTYFTITEPSGFGPYGFSSSTSLGSGQTGETQRWPMVGDVVTYTATIRNRGTNAWTATVHGSWSVDGGAGTAQTLSGGLNPGQTGQFTYTTIWDGANHEIVFSITDSDARSANNAVTSYSKSVAFLTYADITKLEEFRENTVSYPYADTDDLFDWLNIHMARFNRMFADAGCVKRVNYGILEPISDSASDPSIDTISFAVFPFRYRTGEGDPRGSGWYSSTEDIDYGLLHEMGHQLGMIDIYQLDIPADSNQVSGQGYTAVNDLMRACSPFLSEFHALAMNHWQDVAHGYYGQYLYNLPAHVQLRLLDYNGQPLSGATVKAYQVCERPGIGRVISTQVKFEGQTDASGVYTLPNVPIDPDYVPTAYSGDTLHDNPFGYVAVVGTNGVMHFKVEYQGAVDYCWLDITEPVTAYFEGQTDTATFDRQLTLGGPVQHYPPDELTELNATDWAAWAEGATASTSDDTSRKIVGSGSVKFLTDGGFDTYLRYPRTFNAQWDLRAAKTLKVSFYATNPHGFQSGSPWIRLKDANGGYVQYQYYVGGGAYNLLGQAIGTWRSYVIPLDASETESNGWRRTLFSSPDLAHVTSIEIHSDTWDYGFTLWVDGVSFTFDSQPVTSIPAAKSAAGGARVDISDVTVSAAWPDAFYAENADRTFGIRVEKPSHGLSVGDTVRVLGLITTNSDGERTVDASWAEVTGLGDIRPLAMPIRSLGGRDYAYNPSTGTGQQGIEGATSLNNIGLLVRACGVFAYVDDHTFTIDDGSGPMKCVVPDGAAISPSWQYVAVTGASSCERSGSALTRVLRVRSAEDITVLR